MKNISTFDQLIPSSDSAESRINQIAEETADENNETAVELEQIKATLKEREEALKKAQATIERARGLYEEAKTDAENASACTRKAIYKSLQLVRDRVYDIGETVQTASKASGFPTVELNNILASLEIIVQELRQAGLWENSDVLPPLEPVVEKPKKKTSKKKAVPAKKANLGLPENEEFEPIQEQLKLE